jgi:hypothetical protein
MMFVSFGLGRNVVCGFDEKIENENLEVLSENKTTSETWSPESLKSSFRALSNKFSFPFSVLKELSGTINAFATAYVAFLLFFTPKVSAGGLLWRLTAFVKAIMLLVNGIDKMTFFPEIEPSPAPTNVGLT